MTRNALAVAGCCALAFGAAFLAYADGLYSLRNEGITAGGTTGESASYRANTLMADPVDNEGSSASFGTIVEIPEVVIDVPTPVHEEPPRVFRFSLANNSPNPFNPQTTMAFELPQQEAVTLRVFDVAGRLVKTLIAGEVYDQGRHEAIWRGRDDAGRQMSSGTYFYRLEAGEFSETKRMVLLK